MAELEKRGAKETYKCKCCAKSFVARVADRNRGWALFCSKSCKAQNARANPMGRAVAYQREYGGNPQFHWRTGAYEGASLDADGLEWDGHKS